MLFPVEWSNTEGKGIVRRNDKRISVFNYGFLVNVLFFWGCFRIALSRILLRKYRFFWLALLAAAVLMFFFFALLRRNQYVYYWDSGGFWTDSYHTRRQIFSDPNGALELI
jgi:hypothetical protein